MTKEQKENQLKNAHEKVREKSLKRFKENPNIKMSKRGYLMIYIPQEGWKKYHHYIWEQKYGRIFEGFVIHHKNFDRLNNRIENLQMMSKYEHSKLHNKMRKREKNGRYN